MSINVTFAGSPYIIPEVGDAYGTDLTNFLVAVAQKAGVNSKFITTIRNVGLSPYTLVTDDTVVVSSVANGVINLLAGEVGRIVGCYSNASSITNTLTINAAGGQFINGQTSLVVGGGVCGALLQFTGIEWQILSQTGLTLGTRSTFVNTTNNSYAVATIQAYTAAPLVANLLTSTATLSNIVGPRVAIYTDLGQSVILQASPSGLSAFFDPLNLFLPTDAGVGIYVNFSVATVLIKNRLGSTRNIKISIADADIISTTNWS